MSLLNDRKKSQETTRVEALTGPGARYRFARIAYKITKAPRRVLRSSARARLLADKGPVSVLIAWSQDQVAGHQPHPYYKEYRRHERFTWETVAHWLQEEKEAPVETVLDVGSAYGTLALFCKRLFGCRTYCLDAVDGLLSPSLREAFDLTFAVGNIEKDPIPWPGCFDVILFTEVIEHLNYHPLKSLLRIKERMSDRSTLYLTTPDPVEWGRETRRYASLAQMPDPEGQTRFEDGHIYIYSKDELLTLFHQAGLVVHGFDHCPGRSARHLAFRLRKG